MEKLKRKANLKKLQLSSSAGIRKSNRTATTTAIREYFSKDNQDQIDTPIPNHESNTKEENNDELNNLIAIINEKPNGPNPSTTELQQKRKSRTKLTDFVFNDRKIAEAVLTARRLKDDEEIPQKKVKKAPKSISQTSSKKTRSKTNARNKRQPDIKSAFFRNEKLFSEIAAQHCRADNIDPDELQLALAISKSQAELQGIICIDDDENEVNLIEKGRNQKEIENAKDCLRNRFQQYGFKTAEREEFHKLTEGLLPFGNRRTKAKWANKFTPLTLRNPEIQQKKLSDRIQEFLALQNKMKSLEKFEEQINYKFNSDFLQIYEANEEAKIIGRAEFFTTENLKEFFVENLFEVSHTKACYLLKDWDLIQGRDSSPNRLTKKRIKQKQRFDDAYFKLEQELNGKKNQNLITNHAKVSNSNDDENDCKVIEEENIIPIKKEKEIIKNIESSNKIENDSMTIHEYNLKSTKESVFINEYQLNTKYQAETFSLNREDSLPDADVVLNDNSNRSITKILHCTRSTSPDIFADDSEDETTATTITSMIASRIDNQQFIEISSNSNSNQSIIPDYKTSFREPTPAIINYLKKDDDFKMNVDNDEEMLSNGSENCIKTTSNLQEYEEKCNFDMNVDDFIFDNISLNELQNCKKNSINNLSTHNTDNSLIDKEWGKSFNLPETMYMKELETFSLDNKNVKNEETHELLSSPTKTLEHTIYANNEDDCVMISDDELNISICNPKDEFIMKKLENDFIMSSEKNSLINQSLSNNSSNNIGNLKGCVQYLNNEFNSQLSESRLNIVNDNASDLPCTQDSDDDCIVLSDDEINYSICKSAKKARLSKVKQDSLVLHDNLDEYLGLCDDEKSDQSNILDFKSFSSEDFNKSIEKSSSLENSCFEKRLTQRLSDIENDFHWKSPMQALKNSTRKSSKTCNRSLERAEFGILDSQSDTFSQSEYNQTPIKELSTNSCNDVSFLTTSDDEVNELRRFNNRRSDKFSNLIEAVSYNGIANDDDDDVDEFDRLVYGDTQNTSKEKTDLPNGIEQLLTAQISFNYENENLTTSQSSTIETSEQIMQPIDMNNLTDEIEMNGKIYSLRVTNAPKPDFTKQTESELFKQLYKYGIKPLKRKQAIKMLDYIYTQTHPILMEDNVKAIDKINNIKENSIESMSTNSLETRTHSIETVDAAQLKLNLKDCNGALLIRFSHELQPELYNEEYIFQTNISKRLSQALLPLHIAWYNLIQSSDTLHETILMYEPIDLQEIYIFLKMIGYRYDPKDLKQFFDRRCIIFRYDLTASNKNNNRHTRKPKTIGIKKTIIYR